MRASGRRCWHGLTPLDRPVVPWSSGKRDPDQANSRSSAGLKDFLRRCAAPPSVQSSSPSWGTMQDAARAGASRAWACEHPHPTNRTRRSAGVVRRAPATALAGLVNGVGQRHQRVASANDVRGGIVQGGLTAIAVIRCGEQVGQPVGVPGRRQPGMRTIVNRVPNSARFPISTIRTPSLSSQERTTAGPRPGSPQSRSRRWPVHATSACEPRAPD